VKVSCYRLTRFTYYRDLITDQSYFDNILKMFKQEIPNNQIEPNTKIPKSLVR